MIQVENLHKEILYVIAVATGIKRRTVKKLEWLDTKGE